MKLNIKKTHKGHFQYENNHKKNSTKDTCIMKTNINMKANIKQTHQKTPVL